MDCRKIKSIIPKYINHSATEEEINMVEEHLCVCQECRQYLSSLFDKDDTASDKIDRNSVSEEPVKMPVKIPVKIDVFSMLVVAVGIIVVFVSIWLFIKVR